jgi:protein TonB
MLVEQLQTADYLDIIFENRNKEYGAYLLRKDYPRRLNIAMLCTGFIVVCALTLFYTKSHPEASAKGMIPVIAEPENWDPPKEDPPPPPPPPPPAEPQVRTVRNFIPRIIKDDQVKPEDIPPTTDEIINARIGNIVQAGVDDMDITRPPANEKGIIEVPKNENSGSGVFEKVEIESSFPGGPNAWKRFLIKTLRYPSEAEAEFIQGAVAIKFIVDENGVVSNVTAISGPIELRSEALRVIKASGKWIPAVQNGRLVKSYKTQVIVFRLE